MKALALIFCLLTIIPACAQERDTFQPDSIYRVNKVKAKMRYYAKGTKSKLIYQFDRQGRWIEYIHTDDFEEGKIIQRIEFKYDEKGRLIGEVETALVDDRNVIKKSAFEYDKKGRVVKNTKTIDGEISSIVSYNFFPRFEHEEFYRNGLVYREQTYYYYFSEFANRFAGKELGDPDAQPQKIKMPDGTITEVTPPKQDIVWDISFENKMDSHKRLIERKRIVGGELQSETTYQYNEKGLLVERYERIFALNLDTRESFEYQFWE